MRLDKKSHYIFRTIKTKEGKEQTFQIQHIPVKNEEGIVDQFIELVFDVTNAQKARILAKVHPLDIIDSINFGITRFGERGAEVLVTEELKFLKEDEDAETFLTRLAIYMFSGLMQGQDYNFGVFGPFPVLDYHDEIVLIYSFKLPSVEQHDKRLKGNDIGLLMVFIPRIYLKLFDSYDKIESFLNNKASEIETIEIMREEHTDLFAEIREFFLKLIENTSEK